MDRIALNRGWNPASAETKQDIQFQLCVIEN